MLTEHYIGRIIEKLRQKGQTVTFAESCTAGLAAARLVDISGSSDVFRRGFLTYCDEAKEDMLHVRKSTLERYTAVSEACAREMSIGAAVMAEADASVAVTGYAGGMNDPALNGLVYIGIYYEGNVVVHEFHFEGSRSEVRLQARDHALLLLGEAMDISE